MTNIKNRYIKLKKWIINRIVNIEIFYNRIMQKHIETHRKNNRYL